MTQRKQKRIRPNSASAIDTMIGSDITSLQRMQQRLLYGGGAILTLIMLGIMIASIMMRVSDYRAEQLDDFRSTKLAVDSLFIQRDAGYVRTLNMTEYAWHNQRGALMELGDAERRRFIENDYRTTIRASPQAMPWLALGHGLTDWSIDKLDSYLGLTSELSVIAGAGMTERAKKLGTSVYFYDPSKLFFALGRGLDESRLRTATGLTDRAAVFGKLAAPEIDFSDLQALHESQQGNLTLPFYGTGLPQIHTTFGTNPATGEPAVVGSFVVMDGNAPVGAFVVYEPTERFSRWLRQVTPYDVTVMTHDGSVVLATGPKASSDATASGFRATEGRLDRGNGVVTYRHNGQFFIVEKILGTDWSLVRSYTWHDIFRAEGKTITRILLLAILLLAAFWLFLISLDRAIFVPTLSKAKRVYQSEALNRTIIETTPVGLCLVCADDGEPILQNDLVRDYAGVGSLPDAPFHQQLLAAYAGAKRSPEGGANAREFELTLPRAGSDARRHLLIVAMPTTYRNGDAVLFVLRDQTIRVELEESLRQATNAAESASAAKSAFVATVSHEIRTPLNGILGHLELLAKTGLSAGQNERLMRVRQSADSLLSVVSDVLDFTKIEAGKLEAEIVPFDLRELMERIAYMYAPSARDKGVRFYYRIDPMLSRVYSGGEARIEQVLRNLVSNAIKFTHSGKVMLQVSLHSSEDREHEQVRFEVIDSGIGMSDEQIARLFQPFTQADATIVRRFGGTGLGLALCRQLSEVLGGSIGVCSTPNVGSAFTVDLPLAIDTRAFSMREWPLQGLNLVLLSSVAEWREEIGDLLAAWGATVTVVAHPADADVDTLASAFAIVIFDAPWGSWKHEDEVAMARKPIIRASVDGPLVPERYGDELHVNCYTNAALLQGLQKIAGCAVGGVADERGGYDVEVNHVDTYSSFSWPLSDVSNLASCLTEQRELHKDGGTEERLKTPGKAHRRRRSR